MDNSGVPEEPAVSVRTNDDAKKTESENPPQQDATSEVPQNVDPSSADQQVAGGETSKNELHNDDKRDESAKVDELEQNNQNSSPSDNSGKPQSQHIENTNGDDSSNAVKPADASNLSKVATDVAKVENTIEADDEVGSRPSEVQTESKETDATDALNNRVTESEESEGTHLQKEKDATDNFSEKETQDKTDATSKTDDDRTTDAMEIDTKPHATEPEHHGESARGIENNESSKDKEEAAGSGVKEMDIDSECAHDDSNQNKEGHMEKEQNATFGEPETTHGSENATKVGSKDALSKQTVEHGEQGKLSEPLADQEHTGDGNDDEEDSQKEAKAVKDEEMSPQTKASAPEDEENTVTDSGENQAKSGRRPRRSSARNSYEPRSLRPRTAGRVNNSGTASESPKVDVSSQRARPLSGSARAKPESNPTPDLDEERLNDVDDESIPRPTMEANGLVMRIEEAVFVTKDQLDELKIARLTDKKVKPFEEMTFQDLRTYNRDQLRAYCFAYGMARRKKTEMEADMARYLSYWNKGREGFALHDYVPTSSRVIERVEPHPSDNLGTVRGTTSAGSASQDGSATPSTSNGKTSGLATKLPSSRAATSSKGVGTAANSARLSASQGTSAPSGGGTGTSASAGNAMQSGSSQAGTHRNTTTGSRTAKMGSSAPVLPRGFGTSFKQKVHARQGGAKFKAAYNGAGPAIVNIVENAAAYFEGKDSPEVILDQAKSYERYQFNVDMLNEIFDGVPEDSDENDGDVVMSEPNGNAPVVAATKNGNLAQTSIGDSDTNILDTVASRVVSGKRKAQASELAVLEKQFRDAEEQTKHKERTNMRLFQRLERADTKEQVEAVKREFETVHHITFDEIVPSPLVRRKLDKSLPPIVMSDDKCRILRFKVS